MASIVQLDQNTINKIAAGEVIERPAAVVKELVENAIDAGANAVTVEIKNGGISFIRITDNGKGIASDDIKTAFLRHATSKISSVEDLFFVKSLGFRGEALSSIAAVAQVELITKTSDDVVGNRYVIEGGVEKELTSIGCPNGTTFVVKDLFYNTPVRRKFLKTAQTEAGYIYDLLERLAVSHADISFKFVNNGQVKLQTQGKGMLKDIIYSVYGRDIYNNIVEVNGARKSVSLTGYIGKPIISRGNRNYENYYINGRYIKSSIIYKAIEEAYKPYSMVHKYPFVSLHLSIDQKLIDVNVHPTKMEIRFANSHEVYEVVYTTIKNALDMSNRIPKVELVEEKQTNSISKDKVIPEPFEVNRKKEFDFTSQNVSKVENKQNDFNEKDIVDNKLVNNNVSEDVSFSYKKMNSSDIVINEGFSREKYGIAIDSNDKKEKIKGNETEEKIKGNIKAEEIKKRNDTEENIKENTKAEEIKKGNETEENIKAEEIKKGNDTEENIKEEIKKGNDTEENKKEDGKIRENELHENKNENIIQNKDIVKLEQMSMFETVEQQKQIRIVGQVFLTYWIVEYDNKMFIIDQHAAHEKVMYERILKSYTEKKPASQMVAPPIVIALSMREEEVLKTNMQIFNDIGFEIEHFGGMDYMISAVPLDMYGIANKDLFRDLLDTLTDQPRKSTPNLVLEKIASMSCKAAVKGNNRLSVDEAKKLIEQMLKLDNPYNCPHGRPTVIELTKKELEKKFKRQI